MPDCGGHHPGWPPLVRIEHPDQTQLLRLGSPDRLLHPRPGARHDDGRFVERQDLAEGVVAAHSDHARGAGDEGFHLIIEGDRLDIRQHLDPIPECLLLLGLHEGAEDNQRPIGLPRVGFIGADHPIDQGVAVAAAAGRDQNIGFAADQGRRRRR